MAYWIDLPSPTKLAIAPRPRGGDWLPSELTHLRREGVDILVSLLMDEEELELGLTAEAAECKNASIDFRRFPIPDRHTPASIDDFRKFIEQLHDELLHRKSIAAHCRAGIGRSSLLLASLLCREGLTAEDAFRRISQARGLEVPDTQEQIAWVERFSPSP